MSEFRMRMYAAHPTRPTGNMVRVYALTDGNLYLQTATGETPMSQTDVDIGGLPEKVTYSADDRLLIEDAADSFAMKRLAVKTLGGSAGVSKFKVGFIESDWTPTVAELEAAGGFFIVRTQSGPIQITLPEPQNFTDDGALREFWFINGYINPVTIRIANLGTFIDGLDVVRMPRFGDLMHIAGYHKAGVSTFWGRALTIDTNLQVRRQAAWASTNFATPTPIPMDTQETNDNPSVLDWDIGTPSRFDLNSSGHYHIGFIVCIQSTSAVSWSASVWLRKNGTTEIPGSRMSLSMAGNDESCLSFPNSGFDFVAGDYLEIMAEQTSLTGNITGARMIISRLV